MLTIRCAKCGEHIIAKIISMDYDDPRGYCVIKYKCPCCGEESEFVMNA